MSTRILILKDGVITPSRSSSDTTNIINSLGVVDVTTNQTVGGIKTFSGGLALPTTIGTTIGTVWRNVDTLEYKDSTNTTKILLNSAGNLSNLSNRQTSLNNLVGTQTANRLLRSDGTNTTLSQASLTTDVTGVLPIANGGTNSSTQNWVDLTTTQTVAGNKTFSGVLSVLTAIAGTNTTQAASTAFVSTAISNLVASSPAALDTLNELATALGNDANFSTTVTNALASRVDLTTTQNVSGDKYFLNSILVGTNLSLAVQPYSNSNIKSINSLLVVNSLNGSITLTTAPVGTFVFANNDFEINVNTNIAIPNQFLGSHVRVRNYGTGLAANIQGLRLTALNSGLGNVTALDGAAFTARNDTATTVTTLNGGNFAASIGNIAGTATTINGGVFTVSAGAASLSTTIRGILVNASSSNTTPATDCIGIDIANITGTATNKFAIRTGSGIVSFGDTTASTSTTTGALVIGTGGLGIGGNIFSGGTVQGTQFQVSGTKIIGARDTGWTAPTGTTNKGAFASDTATLLETARRLFSLETALRNHGLIGA